MTKSIRNIKVKLTRKKLEGLHNLYEWMISAYVPESNHEHLLHCHLIAMYWRFEELIAKEWKTHTLTISACEAMAFCDLWGNEKVIPDPYGEVIVLELIGKIDLKHKSKLYVETE